MTHARIYASDWKRYRQAHAKLREEAARKLEELFDSLAWDEDQDGAIDLLCDYADRLLYQYGNADAELSASLFDEMMQGSAPRAFLSDLPDEDIVHENIREQFERATSIQAARSLVSGEMQRMVKRCGVETMRENAIANKTMWAWVCIGDTCAFCRTLGSQGWVFASKEVRAGRHAEHIHANCDCEFVVKREGDDLEIEGYDPDALMDEYAEAEGKSWKDRVNAMRRADYTKDFAEQRNARRRELYRDAREQGESPEEAANA